MCLMFLFSIDMRLRDELFIGQIMFIKINIISHSIPFLI